MTETTTTTLPTPEIRTSAPAETLTAPITSPAPTTSAQKMMTPNGYTLFMRGHVLILRCLSDGAVNNFYNVDRVPTPTPHAIERLRQQARALAKRNGVAFTDFLQTRPTPQTKPAPRKLICLSMTSRAVRHRAKKRGFRLKSSANVYRLMLGNDVILAGTLKRISAYLPEVRDIPSKPMPPRALSATYDAIAKRARRRGYAVRKTGLAYTMTRENAVVVGPAQLSELAAYLENCH